MFVSRYEAGMVRDYDEKLKDEWLLTFYVSLMDDSIKKEFL